MVDISMITVDFNSDQLPWNRFGVLQALSKGRGTQKCFERKVHLRPEDMTESSDDIMPWEGQKCCRCQT